MWNLWHQDGPAECKKCNAPFNDENDFVTFCKACNEPRVLRDSQLIRAIKEGKPFQIVDTHSLYIPTSLLLEIDVSPIYDAIITATNTRHFGCRKDHSPKECEAFARLIAANVSHMQDLNIQNGSFNDETGSIAAALKVNKQIRSLKFEDTARHMGLIAKGLEHNTSINEVILIGTNCIDDGASQLFESLAKNKSVKEISFRLESSLKKEAFMAMSEMLKVNTTLETLDFLDSQYGFEWWKIFAEGLAVNKGLKTLKFRNTMDDDSIAVILEALKSNNNTTLESLEVPVKNQQSCIHLTNFLKANTPLQCIYISGFCSYPIEELAEGIRVNTRLKHFGSDCTKPTGDFKPFLEAFKHNKSIESLGLNDTKMNDKAVRALVEVLKVNKSIKSLRFSNCDTQNPETWNMVIDVLKNNNTIEDLAFGPQYQWNEPALSILELAADLIRNNKTIHTLYMTGSIEMSKMHLLKEPLMENETLKALSFRDARRDRDGVMDSLYEEIFSKNYALTRLWIVDLDDGPLEYTNRNKELQKIYYEDTAVLIHNFARSSHAKELLPNELWCHIFRQLKYPGLKNFGSVAERIFKEQSSNAANEKKRKRSEVEEISDSDAPEKNKKRRL